MTGLRAISRRGGVYASRQILRVDVQGPSNPPGCLQALHPGQPGMQQPMQGWAGCRLQQQLRPTAAGPTFHGRRHWPQYLRAVSCLRSGEAGGFVQKGDHRLPLGSFGPQQRHAKERRETRLASLGKGLRRETIIALVEQGAQQRVLRVVALDQHLARLFSPAGTAGHLHHQLGETLGGPKIGGEEAAIGVNDAPRVTLGK